MFQFENDKAELKSLITKLDNIGLNLVGEKEEYLARFWTLKTKWPSEDSYEIVWHQQWVNDGQEKEDIGVELKLRAVVIKQIEFSELLKKHEGLPLRQLITDSIIEEFGSATGKIT
jgi:hypothetical protein